MAISRAQLLKELLPGLNALFGLEYKRYGEEHKEIYETEKSERSFEEETKLSGFSAAPVKNEGSAIAYDNAQEAFTARYTHVTIAQGFSLTEEAIEDNLYDSLSGRYTKALAPVAVSGITETARTGRAAALPSLLVATRTPVPELPVVVLPVPWSIFMFTPTMLWLTVVTTLFANTTATLKAAIGSSTT